MSTPGRTDQKMITEDIKRRLQEITRAQQEIKKKLDMDLQRVREARRRLQEIAKTLSRR